MEAFLLDENYPQFPEGEDPPCAETDPEMFFPEDVSETYATYASGERKLSVYARYYNLEGAKAICATCPAIAACLKYALADQSLVGIWGGTTDQQRRKIRAKYQTNK